MRAAVVLILTALGVVALAAVAAGLRTSGAEPLPTQRPAQTLETSTATRTPAEAASIDAKAYAPASSCARTRRGRSSSSTRSPTACSTTSPTRGRRRSRPAST